MELLMICSVKTTLFTVFQLNFSEWNKIFCFFLPNVFSIQNFQAAFIENHFYLGPLFLYFSNKFHPFQIQNSPKFQTNFNISTTTFLFSDIYLKSMVLVWS